MTLPADDAIRLGGLMLSDERALVRPRTRAVSSPESFAGEAGGLLDLLAGEGINAEFLTISPPDFLCACISRRDGRRLAPLLADDAAWEVLDGVALISLYPMRGRPAVLGGAVAALAGAGVQILAMGTSLSALCLVVDAALAERAGQALTVRFGRPFCRCPAAEETA